MKGIYASTPTWSEQGVDCVIGSWRGAGAPIGVTADQIAFWEGVLSKAVKTKEWNAELDRYFWTEMYLDGPELADYLKREYAEMREMLGDLGLLAAA